jgi:acylphosphatase
MAPEQKRRVKVTVSGRVQGVWYRAWTREEARDLGLDGWVRNRPDGSVEAVLEGLPGDVEVMLRLLWSGPPLARVDGVVAQDWDEPVAPGFEQRPTG